MSDQNRAGLSTDEMAQAVASLSAADTVPSPFGDLRFFDGLPLPETVATAYDALDLMRGIEVFLNAEPGASLVAFRKGLLAAGVTTVPEGRESNWVETIPGKAWFQLLRIYGP